MGTLKSAAIRGLLPLSLGLLIVGFLLAGTRNDAKAVLKVPEGFIAEEELKTAGLRLSFWETQVAVMEGAEESTT